MEFKSQKVAYPYFALALLLFVLQVLMGLWLSINYFVTLPQSLVDVFPFATARAMHTNLLVLWGFAHTLPQINYYTHGSQVTVSHGHLAFFGAYAMLNLMVFYFAMPNLVGREDHTEGRGKFGFWTMISAMFCLGLCFGIAGILQAYLERVLGFGYMAAQEQMRVWFMIAFFCGLGFLVGLLVTVYDLFFPKPIREAQAKRVVAQAVA